MTIPAVEGGAVGTVARIHREAGIAHYRRLGWFFSCAWAARQGIPWDAVDDLRRIFCPTPPSATPEPVWAGGLVVKGGRP